MATDPGASGAVVVRPARRDEVAAVLELWRVADAVPSVSDDPGSLGRLLEASADALLVAEAEGRVAGTIIAGWDGWRGNLYRLAVLPTALPGGPPTWPGRPSHPGLAAAQTRRRTVTTFPRMRPSGPNGIGLYSLLAGSRRTRSPLREKCLMVAPSSVPGTSAATMSPFWASRCARTTT